MTISYRQTCLIRPPGLRDHVFSDSPLSAGSLKTCYTQGFQYFSSLPVLHYLQAVLFYQNLKKFHKYLIQHSLKSGGTKDHFRWIKIPGTVPY